MATTISGTAGVTFPAGGVGNPAGAVVGTTDTQTLTNKTLSTGLVMGVSAITSGTAQASTSGTSIDFTSIPSWVKRITVMLSGVSTNGTSDIVLRVGSGSVLASGYVGGVGVIRSGSTSNGYAFSSAFIINGEMDATNPISGYVSIALLGSNTWVEGGVCCNNIGSRTSSSGGSVPVGGTLDRVRITTANGTDTFDLGSINILYE